MLPLASRMPVSMASLLRSDSVNPLRNSSSYRGTGRSKKRRKGEKKKEKTHSCDLNQSGHFCCDRGTIPVLYWPTTGEQSVLSSASHALTRLN